MGLLHARRWVCWQTLNVAGPTTPLADQRSPASPGSVSMGLGTWLVTVALPEIKAVDIEKKMSYMYSYVKYVNMS